MNATERFVHEKVDCFRRQSDRRFGYRHPTRFPLFHSEMRLELRSVYKDVLIVECPSLSKCLENPNVEGKHLLWVRTRISTFVGYVS